ncbi:hypothetical protein K402DRAFT_457189 [Aulographum hederae CBS 113979]|uniref:Uncharacterized protein n=1 Tax=Aulographum hederae CBS 113979 TaxID=1176131 RepID=A0A6G1GPE3_9PEZI|nr:hypothetical protein K402DRAFT_457189 [Aulographum hederae CBS 113979]
MDPVSLASGIAGLLTLSTTVLTAGYKYINSISSASEDFKNLLRETASLNAVLSQLVSHSLSESEEQTGADALLQHNLLQDCQEILKNIQLLIRDCEIRSTNRGKKTLSTLLWPLKQQEIVKSREHLRRLYGSLHTIVSVKSASVLRAIEQEQKEGIVIVKELARNTKEGEELKILDWLSSLDPLVKHAATTSLKQPGTHEWFLQETLFLDWFDPDKPDRMLWLHGTSGTGKTVLALPTLDPCQIVGSIIRQLAGQMDNLPPAIRKLYNECSGRSPQLDKLLGVLEEIVAQSSMTAFVILDGLDESPNRDLLLRGMRRICENTGSTSRLRVLLSSRSEQDIKQALASIPAFSIKAQHNHHDMEIHVRAELGNLPRIRAMPASAQDALLSDLVARANGMFRWIQCQLDTLKKARTRQALSFSLQNLPPGLDETYDRILKSIDEADHKYVRRMLYWMIGSGRPLSLEELAEAIALNPDKDRLDVTERLLVPEEIFELCGSLIRVADDQTIVLAHFSVQEYLMSDRLTDKEPSLAQFAIQEIQSRQHVASCILSYVVSIGLRVQSLQQDILDEAEFPMISYMRSVHNSFFREFDIFYPWIKKHLFPESENQAQWLHLNRVRDTEVNLASWEVASTGIRLLQCALMCFWNGPSSSSHYKFQLESIVATKAKERVKNLFIHMQRVWESAENHDDAFRRRYDFGYAEFSPLCGTASFGFDRAMRDLLENGASVDGDASINFMDNPLIRAVDGGNEGIVHTLREYGADKNIRASYCFLSTALVALNEDSPELAEYLVEDWQLDTNIMDIYGRTIHYWAVHDTRISRILRPLSARLEALRGDRDVDFVDVHILHTTILNILKDIKRCSDTYQEVLCGRLSKCLFRLGTDHNEHAAIFAEVGVSGKGLIEHPYFCNLYTDLCGDCYSSWEKSRGQMDYCKGHTFYKIPRDCWHGFEEGVVSEDGSTLAEVIDFLEEKFTRLLEDGAL